MRLVALLCSGLILLDAVARAEGNSAEWKALLAQADKDGDGKLDVKEILAADASSMSEDMMAEVEEDTFRDLELADRDGDKKISEHEWPEFKRILEEEAAEEATDNEI